MHAELLTGRCAGEYEAGLGVPGDAVAGAGACLSRDVVRNAGSFGGRLLRRGSREDGVEGSFFGPSKSILSDIFVIRVVLQGRLFGEKRSLSPRR